MRPLAIGNIFINYMIAVCPQVSPKCLGCLVVQLLSQIHPEVAALEELSPVCVTGGVTGTASLCKDLGKVNK